MEAALFLVLSDVPATTSTGAWANLPYRRFGDSAVRKLTLDDHVIEVKIAEGGYTVTVDGRTSHSSASLKSPTEIVTQFSTTRSAATVIHHGHKLHVFSGGKQYIFTQHLSAAEEDVAAATGSDNLISPMPATVIEVRVKPGDKVTEGQVCAVLESMKMEINIRAARDGVIGGVNVEKGQVVEEGAVLVALEKAESA